MNREKDGGSPLAYRVQIPLKVNSSVSLNRIYAGMHYASRKRLADELHLATRAAVLSSPYPAPFEKPVDIKMWFHSSLDIDNHGFLAKCIIDGLKGVILHDDNKRYVRSLTLSFWDGEGVGVEVTEHERRGQ